MPAVIPFALLLCSALPSFWALRSREQRACQVLGWVLLGALIALPWTAPAWPWLRFFVAICVVLAVGRHIEALLGHAPQRAATGLAAYAAYYLSVAELAYSDTPEDERCARRLAAFRLLRAAAKMVALASCFALSTALPSLHDYWPLHALWCLYGAYFAASGGADVHSAIVMLLSGHRAHEVFNAPPFATSPRDFWSRRWNAMFRNSAHRLVFTPLGGAAHPVRAVLGVFLSSAVVHEYLVLAALGRTSGHMFAFFMLHGVATLLTGLRRTPWPVPRGVDVLLHSMWLVLTAPLFFAPLEEIFAVRQWRLW